MSQTAEPIEINVNGDPVSIAIGTTISQLLLQLEIKTKAVAVEINEVVQPRAQHEQRVLEQGDWLEIVTLVGGG